MNQAKVQFSNSETDLMANSEIILTKNKILEKVKSLLENLQEQLIESCKCNSRLFSNEIFLVHPKISRGENYLGLPYLILDYPRFFKQQDIFAIRTMFWWGNFYSITLQLSGFYKVQYLNKIEEGRSLLAKAEYSIGINEDPWIHHFGTDNYVSIISLNEEIFLNRCREQRHLKIAKRFSLNDNNVSEKITENWKLLTEICFD